MTTQFPPSEPLDDQERLLARIVRALPGGDPPATLDARILRAAANAAAASRQPRARWLASAGAVWGIGGAAAAVLALGIGWQGIYGGPRPARSETAPAAVMADQAEDSSIAVQLETEHGGRPENLPPPTVADAAPARRVKESSVAASTPAPVPEPFTDTHLDEHVAARAEAGSSAEAMASAPAMADRISSNAIAAKASAGDAQQPSSALSESRANVDATQAQGSLAGDSRIHTMKPASWLAQIRQLRKEQRTTEARASLVAFHKRYPDFVIPSDLAPLLASGE